MAMPWITSLPEDIIIDCVARLPRRYYPTLALVSKFFRSLIASPELYARRALLDRTECCLYVAISKSDDNGHRLYTLGQKSNSAGNYCLVPITSLPHRMPRNASYVAVDSKIFVIGGSYDEEIASNGLLLIDCRFHTADHHLPIMPTGVTRSVSGFINGKIYVIGGDGYDSDGVRGMMVFDMKTETWESKTLPDDVGACKWHSSAAVTWHHKLYFRTLQNCFVYDPNEDKFEKDEILKTNPWYDNECVMEGVLYYYCPFSETLEGYVFKERCWKVVKGVERLSSDHFCWPRTVMYNNNVVVLFPKQYGIWCAEIKVERDGEGEICGRVEWCGCVLEGNSPYLKKCLVVKV